MFAAVFTSTVACVMLVLALSPARARAEPVAQSHHVTQSGNDSASPPQNVDRNESAGSTVRAGREASGLLKPFEIRAEDNLPDELEGELLHGLLRRSAQTGLDWYFTSLALAISPDETLLDHQAHFEGALKQLAVAGPMPKKPLRGLRRISDSHQLWELQATLQWELNWDCAFTEFPKGAPLGWRHLDDCGRIWRNWGRVAPDSHWSLIDTSDDLKSLRIPDSHDSQAAVFLFALSRWLWLYGEPAGFAAQAANQAQIHVEGVTVPSLSSTAIEWLNTPYWIQPAGTAGQESTDLTRIELIKRMIRHNLLNHMQDGLFRTFRHNRHPQGGMWDVQYLMDNIECQAALRALIPVFDAAGHTAFADVLRRYESELSLALDQLVSQQASAPATWRRWARQGDWPASAAQGGELAFYPHVAGQYWEGLFEAAFSEKLQQRWTLLEPHLGPYSDWWRHRFLHLGAGLPAYLARMRQMPNGAADVSPTLLKHAKELRPDNALISDFVAAWQIHRLLAR